MLVLHHYLGKKLSEYDTHLGIPQSSPSRPSTINRYKKSKREKLHFHIVELYRLCITFKIFILVTNKIFCFYELPRHCSYYCYSFNVLGRLSPCGSKIYREIKPRYFSPTNALFYNPIWTLNH